MKLRSSLPLSALLVTSLWAGAAPIDDARALAKAGKLDQAIAQLETALRAGGADKPTIALELARTQIAAGKLITAQQTVERLLRETPAGPNTQAIALLNAQLREAGGNVADALSLYRTIAEITPAVPERADALAGSIRTAALLTNAPMVERSLTEFTESFPQDERAREFLLRLIRQRAAISDNKGAAEAVHRYKAAYPQDPASSTMYEFMYLSLAGDYKGAIPVYQAERKLPNFTWTYGIAAGAIEAARRDPSGYALIEPVATEFATLTGDPQLQILAMEYLPSLKMEDAAVKLGTSLLPKLDKTAWAPRLRLALANALRVAKNDAEAEKQIVAVLAANPANGGAWDIYSGIVSGLKRPEAYEALLKQTQATLPALKNYTLQQAAQSEISYRLAALAFAAKDLPTTQQRLVGFLEKEGLSTESARVTQLATTFCFAGVTEATKALETADTAYKTARTNAKPADGKKPTEAQEKAVADAKAAAEKAQKDLDDVRAASTARLDAVIPAFQKYLTRTMTWGPAVDAIQTAFKPFFALNAKDPNARKFNEMLQEVRQQDLAKTQITQYIQARDTGNWAKAAQVGETLLPKLLETGGAVGLEAGNNIIAAMTNARVFPKVIIACKAYFAKYPGATGPIPSLALSGQQLGAPKNIEVVAMVNDAIAKAGGSTWPNDQWDGIRRYTFEVLEQNRQPADMEVEYKTLVTTQPGNNQTYEFQRRLGVAYAATGDMAAGKKWLLESAKNAQPTGADPATLYAMGTSFTDAAPWALPAIDAYLARANRGPQQGNLQLLRAHMLVTEKKDLPGAAKALHLAATRPADLAVSIGSVPWQWGETLFQTVGSKKVEEVTPQDLTLLNDLTTALGPVQGHWLPGLLLRQAQLNQHLEFTQTLNRLVAAQNPNDGGSLTTYYLAWSQQLVTMEKQELAGLVLRNAVNRFTGVDPKLRAQASQALASLSTKFGFTASEIDDKLEWAPLLHAAQSFRMGDPIAAWKSYQEHEALFQKHEDKLSADFLRWVSDRLLQREDEPSRDAAERILRRWIIANENSTVVPADEKAKTQLALADFYFKTLRYDLSRSECTSLINRFPNTSEAVDAQFRIGECFLNQKMYVDAAKVFEGMAKSKDKISASRGEFLLGVLAQQRGDADDAKARFRNVMDLAPTSEVADAILYRLSELYGQENRFRDELMLLRSIGLIGSSAKQWHPPGIPLNIVIQDADLGVSRGQSYVPVVVTTSSGDREVVRLESGSAGKGFFRAELPTELGDAKPGDNILQVNGSDTITYDYPEEFKKQFTAIAKPVSNIRLASDAEFKISATEIKDELEVSFEDRLREQRQRSGKQVGVEFRQEFRNAIDLKPGNNVYLQVKDADRDTTKDADTVTALVTAASGSRVSVPLTETGSHTGIFRGILKTTEIAANVFASDRSVNNEAVRAIDNNRKTAWEGLNDGKAPKYIVLDLKQPKKLGTLKWANDGFTRDKIPTEYAVQTSDNGADWKTVAATAKFTGATPEQTARIETKTEKNDTSASIKLDGGEGRYVRLFIEKFSGTSPRIAEIELTDTTGGLLIPAKADEPVTAGEALRLTPSDRISATYEDETSMASVGKARTLNQQLQATYYNGKIDFIAYEFKAQKGQSVPEKYVKQVRRVDPGQRVIVRIQDYDADVSDQRDTVKFTLKASDGTETQLEATETEPFTGVFTKEIDIWSAEHPNGLKLAPGTKLEAVYLDTQNTDPGAPINRTAYLEPVTPGDVVAAFVQTTVDYDANGNEKFQFKSAGADAPPIKPVAFRVPLTFEIIDPAAAKDSFSEIKATLTTSGGSSVEVICPLAEIAAPRRVPGKDADDALEAGRFVGQIFMNLGDKDSPPTIVLEPGDTRTLVQRRNPAIDQDEQLAHVVPVLNLNGQDVITVSYQGGGKEYKDQARLSVPASAEFTDSGYEKPVTNLYIGDKIYLAVKDLTADATPERDSVQVKLTSQRGEIYTVKLEETLSHSGEFTGSFPLVAGEKPVPNDDKMEAWFGDTITLTFASKNDPNAKFEKTIGVVKGTDANMLVFEKKYATEKVAIESQFRMAEAYFELFKNYRALKQTPQATNALNEGMLLLKELSVDYPSKQYEARTDYLLGQFAQELKQYDEAIAYYKRIVQNHSDHPLAPDAQYKLGQCHEEKGDMDAASAEYVTLAYTWPDNPLVGNVVVRIAEYFYNKKEYPTAAEVSKKFVDRFPQHEWAERMLFRCAQCWFKADQFVKAGTEFDLLVENYPRGKFRADAVFWAGESYRSANQLETAYRRYKRATWDFPESDAAKFARGKLVLPEMVSISDKEAQQ
ncbi:MAG TPA: tetratricopeptide repeat protein [Chthoniobacteraceae bacterium]|jgi:TolA-binding protein|nr:tetratricopeptide repeat protein [Chthoniobacteraceae bacterium]